MCGCLLLKQVNELKPSLQTAEWRDSHFFSKKTIKNGNWAFLFFKLLLKPPIKWSHSLLVQGEADLFNPGLRIVCRAVDLCQGLC